MVKGLKESVDSDTVRTIPCDAAFTLPIFGISLKRSLFSGLLDIHSRFFLWLRWFMYDGI